MAIATIDMLRSLLREAISPIPPAYFILINVDSIQFLKASHGRLIRVVLTTEECSPDMEGLERFLNALDNSADYFGQPVVVLVNNDESFSYFKRLGDLQPVQILERLSAMQSESVQLRYEIVKGKQHSYFVTHAIEGRYLQGLINSMDSSQIPVTVVTTLPVFLFPAILPTSEKGNSVVTIDFEQGRRVRFQFDDKESILFDCQENDSNGNGLKITIFPDECGVESSVENQNPSVTVSSLSSGYAFIKALRSLRRHRKLHVDVICSKSARILGTALNSAKLLVLLMLSFLILLSTAVAITSLVAGRRESAVQEYQQQYAARLELIQKLDSLQSEQEKLNSELGTNHALAPILSGLFQKSYGDVYLTRINLNPHDTGLIRVEVLGKAKSEPAVFRYLESLNDNLAPFQLRLNSITPEVIRSRNTVDTSLVFNFSGSIHE